MVDTSAPPDRSAQLRRTWWPIAFGVVPLTGAIAITAGGGIVGALIDDASGHDILVMFTVLLAAAAALSVLVVRRDRVIAALVAVPLVYLALVLVVSLASHPGGLTYTLALNFTIKAPATLVSSGAALAVALARLVAQRR